MLKFQQVFPHPLKPPFSADSKEFCPEVEGNPVPVVCNIATANFLVYFKHANLPMDARLGVRKQYLRYFFLLYGTPATSKRNDQPVLVVIWEVLA